ncbi:MAG: YbaB/EbfC family nucleoid-associated protein [Bacteroidetes bacterium]|nr:YbaB/EbfC family nucleoid-associated protein [Bacteroidota bacterium]
MFGDLLGNLEAQQAQLKEKLGALSVRGTAGDEAVVVEANGALELKSIQFDTKKLDFSDLEQLEDLVLAAANNALDAARQLAAQETGKLMEGMLPGGLGSLFNPGGQ